MNSSLVISLDFELMWGVRDHRSIADYGDAVLGVREAIPAMLQRFHRHRVRATWATVGLVFARNRKEMLEHAPCLRPVYRNVALSPYPSIQSQIGDDEGADPYHYGYSLVRQIVDTEGQEVGSHTFSHYYCLEPGESIAAFDADLKAARSMAESQGQRLTSLVFPRNQMTPEHLACSGRNGFIAVRGNPINYMYRPRAGADNSTWVRALRLLDAAAPLVEVKADPRHLSGELTDIPATRFLRPFNPKTGAYNTLHLHRIVREMTTSARSGKIYHLWWHPHNFGRHLAQNLAQLDAILECFAELRDRYDMRSRTMTEAAQCYAELRATYA